MRFENEGKITELFGVEAIVFACFLITTALINRVNRAAQGTIAVVLVVVPVVFICPSWELAPWLRLHALSVFVAVFIIQLIFPHPSGKR